MPRDLANYIPDFIVRTRTPSPAGGGKGRGEGPGGAVWIVETKGRAELDPPQNMACLKQWCAHATAAEENGQRYDFVFVDHSPFDPRRRRTVSRCQRLADG